MAVSKCPCLTFTIAMSCLDAKISLVPKHELIVPQTLLAPATHIWTNKATKKHTLTPLTYELFFQNSSTRILYQSLVTILNNSCCIKLGYTGPHDVQVIIISYNIYQTLKLLVTHVVLTLITLDQMVYKSQSSVTILIIYMKEISRLWLAKRNAVFR